MRPSGEKPSTSCRRWLRTSERPITLNAETSAASTATRKPRFSNRLRSIRGEALPRCRRANQNSADAPIAAALTAAGQEAPAMATSLIAAAKA